MFVVEKRFGGNNLELTDKYLIDKDVVAEGLVVAFDGTNEGVVELGVSNDSFVGIITAKYQFPETDPLGPDANDRVKCLMLPLRKDIPVVADITDATAGSVIPGFACDVAAGGLTLDSSATINGDFVVTEVIAKDGSGNATKVIGKFTDTVL